MAELDSELDAQERVEAIQQYGNFLLTLHSDLDLAKQVLEKHQHDLGAVTAFINDIKDLQKASPRWYCSW